MTRIATGQHIVTLVNVFSVAPDRQQALVDLLVAATEQTMCHQPGYVSANIHRSLDGTKVVNYAQWRRAEDLEAMLANPEADSHLQEANELARSEPGLYEVVFTHSSS